jgi:carboxyl-terminal processing protease
MLKVIKDDIKKNYYDPNFHGIDLEVRFKTAEEKMQQAESVGQIFGIIAQALVEFEDSHTFFWPPDRANKTEYGWQMQAYGDKCYVTAIKPGSDAETKGLRLGDQVLMVNGFKTSREVIWKMNYLFYTLRPTPAMQVIVQGPDGSQRQIEFAAKVKQGKRLLDISEGGTDRGDWEREIEAEDRLNAHRYTTIGEKVMVWKMPGFDLSESDVGEMMGKVKKHEAMILDLRGNGGGYVKTLEWLTGYFIDNDLKIAELKGRKEMKPQMAKTRGKDGFKGKLVVLVDSKSGSAAEIFARVIQLEKRGMVIGDRTAGAVMQSRSFNHFTGDTTRMYYGASITNADVIMSDGKSLEHVGVTPDEFLLPTAADLAAKRDPVLSSAAALLGILLTQEKAGAMFPIEWRK